MTNRTDPAIQSKIIKACRYIESRCELPALAAVARHVNLSPHYFQKLFTRALGVSPRQYADALRYDRLRERLKNGDEISRALYDAGFGASSRLYEFADRYLGMTPGDFKNKGKDKVISYCVVGCPLGRLLLAATDKGLCAVRLGESRQKLLSEFRSEFASARHVEGEGALNKWAQALIDYLSGKKPWPLLPYDVQATAFQRTVWEKLRAIPSGETYNYAELAAAIGRPKAARAVARACASNPVALVIPCHRIVPKTGGTGGYRWKPQRKEKLLKLESRPPRS